MNRPYGGERIQTGDGGRPKVAPTAEDGRSAEDGAQAQDRSKKIKPPYGSRQQTRQKKEAALDCDTSDFSHSQGLLLFVLGI